MLCIKIGIILETDSKTAEWVDYIRQNISCEYMPARIAWTIDWVMQRLHKSEFGRAIFRSRRFFIVNKIKYEQY